MAAQHRRRRRLDASRRRAEVASCARGRWRAARLRDLPREQRLGPTGPASTLRALEVLGLDPVAEQALWEWLFAMDLMGTITAWRCPVPHPLQQWLLEPRRLGLTVGDGMWLRILDLPAALSARTYVGDGTLVLDVTDALIESNAGRWQLAVKGGSATVTRTKAEADLELDIAALASTYLGAYRFGDLATSRPGPRMPAGQPPDRGRAVHPVPLPVGVDPVLTRRGPPVP